MIKTDVPYSGETEIYIFGIQYPMGVVRLWKIFSIFATAEKSARHSESVFVLFFTGNVTVSTNSNTGTTDNTLSFA